jgi:hypothetical protein
MKKHQLLLFFSLLTLLFCCKKSDEQKKETPQSNSEGNLSIKLPSDDHPYIDDDSLATFLKSKLSKIALDSKFKIEKRLTDNRHVDNLKDTIITRTFENTVLTSYKGVDEEWIFEASIENKDFKLTDYIQVGSSKKVVEKSLGIVIPNDILTIGNLEQTSQFILKFESGYIKQIEYEGYFD